MRRYLSLFAGLALMVSCSEVVDVHVRNMDRTYLVVESYLTDRESDEQTVILSESINYFSKDSVKAVRSARVSVDDGGEAVTYEETEVPGVYRAPKGYHGTPGKTYHLTIHADVGGRDQDYEALSTMPEPGFQLDSIDYAYAGGQKMQMDSVWTVAVWGRDKDILSYYYITAAVNGNYFPYDLSLAIDDKYFAGQKVTGFPITMIYQSEKNQKMYGDCCKYLETGDTLTIKAYTLPRDGFDFYMSFAGNSLGGIPMFSPQPANCPTNITGGDAMGMFIACPVCSADRVVDDPLRPLFKHLMKLMPKF